MQNVQQIQSIVDCLKKHVGTCMPSVGIVLGTGLGGIVNVLTDKKVIHYTELPNFPQPTAQSHIGQFVVGTVQSAAGKKIRVIVQQGRCHLFEGYNASEVCTGVRVMAGIGVTSLIITNVAGALNPRFDAGDLMLITDHINTTGHSPLRGCNHEAWGVRFPDMSQTYDPAYMRMALETATRLGIRLERGVYVGVLGPQLETPAETRFLRQIGADAVGMSTVLEVIAAKHMGLRVLGISCLSNKNLPDCMEDVPLEKILQTAALAEKRFTTLVQDIITQF